MSMTIAEFRRLGIYEEAPGREECSFTGGKVSSINNLPATAIHLLNNPRGSTHGGDPSRQDSSAVTSLLKMGLSPADVYATFLSTPRGQDAITRKNGHFDDYMTRTIEKAQGFMVSNSIRVDFSTQMIRPTGTGLTSFRGDEVEVSKVNWVWKDYIPAGKLTVVAGDPGMGKSTLVGDIIARITRGRTLPSGERSVTGTCIIASGEDAANDTIVPRLVACGADLKRITLTNQINSDESTEIRFLTFPRDIDLLREKIIALGARICVIDPLNAFISGVVDSHKDHDIRRVLSPLETIAQETGCAIVAVAHLNKSEKKDALYRVSGTIGIVAAARSVLGVAKLSDDRNVLFVLKTNLARKPSALSYRIRPKRIYRSERNNWKGDEDVIHATDIEWIGKVDYNPNANNQVVLPEDQVIRTATNFLQQLLHNGEMNSDQIFQEGKSQGITRTHLNRARSLINVNTILRSGSWYWSLTDD